MSKLAKILAKFENDVDKFSEFLILALKLACFKLINTNNVRLTSDLIVATR